MSAKAIVKALENANPVARALLLAWLAKHSEHVCMTQGYALPVPAKPSKE